MLLQIIPKFNQVHKATYDCNSKYHSKLLRPLYRRVQFEIIFGCCEYCKSSRVVIRTALSANLKLTINWPVVLSHVTKHKIA